MTSRWMITADVPRSVSCHATTMTTIAAATTPKSLGVSSLARMTLTAMRETCVASWASRV